MLLNVMGAKMICCSASGVQLNEVYLHLYTKAWLHYCTTALLTPFDFDIEVTLSQKKR
jgi:hypothetical protein